jgi:hypothetical protein
LFCETHTYIASTVEGAGLQFAYRLTYASAQVMRFYLAHKTKEITAKNTVAQNKVCMETYPCNVEFTHEHAGENINIIFKHLDELIKNPPSLLEYIGNTKIMVKVQDQPTNG